MLLPLYIIITFKFKFKIKFIILLLELNERLNFYDIYKSIICIILYRFIHRSILPSFHILISRDPKLFLKSLENIINIVPINKKKR